LGFLATVSRSRLDGFRDGLHFSGTKQTIGYASRHACQQEKGDLGQTGDDCKSKQQA